MNALEQLGAVTRLRGGLPRTAAALARGALTMGFLGGSITDMKTSTRWPEALLRRLTRQYPSVRFTVENAALGATGSDLGAFRAEPAIIAHGCDLVFVEYSVNDHGQPTARRSATREGVLRQLRAAGCDVMLVHTFCPEMLGEMNAGGMPPSVAEFEVLAEAYRLDSVWAGLHALRAVANGELSWSEWLPDGLHPEVRGSLVYADAVADALRQAWSTTSATVPLPPRVHADAWDNVQVLALEQLPWRAPWTLRRWTHCPGIEQVLHTEALGAQLEIRFAGRGLVLGFDFGALASEIRFQIDGGRWCETKRERPAWAGPQGWYRPELLADGLPPGEHRCLIETQPGPMPAGGSLTAIGLVGVIR